MTNTWSDCYIGPFRVPPQYLGWAVRGFASVYRLILMPAYDMPYHDAERFSGALSLREIFHSLAESPDQMIAFHPEAGGYDTLIHPPLGIGRVLSALDRRHIPCIPTGVFERDGRFAVRFGEPLHCGLLANLDDEQAADEAMRAIARLVPPDVRGVYADGACETARERMVEIQT